MNLHIRPATAGDFVLLCELAAAVHALHRARLPRIFQAPEGPVWDEERYRAWLDDENVVLFLAEIDGRPAGYAYAVLRIAPALPIFTPRCYAVVEDIGVAAAAQGQGVGRSLMERVQAWATAQGATTVELNVYEFNQGARAFYAGLGYATLSRKMSKTLE
ncbi:MAG: GNAT family N-acetyltransferase [Caldilineaceae bacterium]|nr:GNAT family N-acetyltransferase [Caldilineaceae bacterium]